MRNALTLLAGLALFAVGCSDGWQEHAALPASYVVSTNAHIDEVTKAVDGWNAFGPTLTIQGDASITIRFAPHDEVDAQCGLEGLGGCTNGSEGHVRIYIDEALPASLMPQIIAHELGHAMGLGHDVAGTVMYGEADQYQAPMPTLEDRARFEALR